MEKSKVYFTTFKTSFTENLLQKLRRLMITAGIRDIDFEDKYTAIKIHFGELGNLAFLRPNYAKVVADLVKEGGGKPFLTDCNTLYVGSRKNGGPQSPGGHPGSVGLRTGRLQQVRAGYRRHHPAPGQGADHHRPAARAEVSGQRRRDRGITLFSIILWHTV